MSSPWTAAFRPLPLLLLTFLSGPAAAAEDVPGAWDRPTEKWYEGPARYLLSRDEEKQYRSLDTEARRERFIEDFWARRDPDPGTPVNEFRVAFTARVAEAERRFRDAPYPGWKTDRGKLFVLLGPPDELRQGNAYSPLGKEVPYVIWIYHHPRFEGMDRDTEVRFARDDSGELKLSDRLFMGQIEKYFDAPRMLTYQVGASQRPPEPRQLLDALAAENKESDERRFRTHYDYFLAADGSTSVVLTLGIRNPAAGAAPFPLAPPAGDWKVYARLAAAEGSYDLVAPDSFRTADFVRDVDGFRLFQGRISVPARAYTVLYGLRNEGTQELISFRDRISVPEFSGGRFALSGITLASKLEEAGAEANPPFQIGRLRVVPKMDPVFTNGDELAYYVQVYRPAPDPATGEALLDLSYRFYRADAIGKTGEPSFQPLGEPVVREGQAGAVHGYAFPLKGWPPGQYKLKVTARNRPDGAAAEAEVRFTVR